MEQLALQQNLFPMKMMVPGMPIAIVQLCISQIKSRIYILLCLREGAFHELILCFCVISSLSALILCDIQSQNTAVFPIIKDHKFE